MFINPENKCKDLVVNEIKVDDTDSFFNMLIAKESLEKRMCESNIANDRCGRCPAKMHDSCGKFENLTFMQRIRMLEYFKQQFDHEFSEMMERLPYKVWKNYPESVLNGEFTEDEWKEVEMELIDQFHFFLSLVLFTMYKPGNNKTIADRFVSLFFSKQKENMDRQDRGY